MSDSSASDTASSQLRLVVALGASAGGLHALQRFFRRVVPGTDIAWVVVQHLDPDRQTMMPELLAKEVPLPIAEASDETLLEPDRIYAIPPNATLTVEAGVLRVREPVEERGHRLPIDVFFSSLADDLGPYAVCIVLSGAGSDGTAGLRRIKERGGMAIAQSAETAEHQSMPRSAASTGLVDHVLPPEEMFEVIRGYADHLSVLEQDGSLDRLQQEIVEEIPVVSALLHERTGHDFSGYKRSTLSRRIQRRVQVTRSPSVAAYLERLQQDEEEAQLLLRDLLIGVTRFFRDPEAFAALRELMVRELVTTKRSSLRIWVPGCATGQEAYSLAILVREAMYEAGVVQPRLQIFATDIDQEALAVARRGVYGQEIEENVSPERLDRFFLRTLEGWQVRPSLREQCVFSPHNVITDPPFARLDLISCRNLLIYIHRELQVELLGLFHFALNPGGLLFLGPSENPGGTEDLFASIDKKHRLLQARERSVHRSVHLPALEPGRRSQMFRRTTTAALPEPRLENRVRRTVLERYAPVSVLVDGDLKVILTTGPTGRYLQLPIGGASLDLLELAEPGLRAQLRPLLQEARRRGEARTDAVVEREGSLVPVRLRVVRFGSEEEAPAWLILFDEREEFELPVAAEDGDESHVENELIARLRRELHFVQEQLQSTVEELETANEELKASNEELLSMNEELQSTNEELQTSEEELQSRNEELETVNSELQETVQEVNRAHADLQNLFESTAVATLFLDRDLNIQRFTPASAELFRLRPGDAGRHLGDITARFEGVELLDEAAKVLDSLESRQLRVVTPDRRTFQLRIGPYTTLEHTVEGVVLTFAEVTDLVTAQERERKLAAAVESARDAVYLRDLDGMIRTWNPAAARLFGYPVEEAVGMSFRRLVPAEGRAEQVEWEERIARGESVGPVDTERLTRDGARVPISLSLSPVLDDEGRVTAVAAVARDVSRRMDEEAERQRLADELAQRVEELAAADARKDEFLAMLAHELRNPLAPIFSSLALLRRPEVDAGRRDELLDTVERQGRQLSRLVDDLLDVSRITRGKIRLRRVVLDVREVLEQAVDMHSVQLGELDQVVDRELPAQPVWVQGDAVRLQQIFGNLIHNASKFSPPRSRIDLHLSLEEGWVTVEVSDEGIGFGEELGEHLFDLFAQGDRSLARSEGGLGVGLTTVRRLAELHGGSVTASSPGRDQGATFRVRLPLAQEQAVAERDAKSRGEERAAERKISARTVLVVEDNVDAAEGLATLLELSGHRCWVAHDGERALELFAEHSPEVVLLDIGLPVMDGLEVAKRIRESPPGRSALLVAVTGYGQEDLVRRALDNGFDHHLLKPAHPEEIKRLMAQHPA